MTDSSGIDDVLATLEGSEEDSVARDNCTELNAARHRLKSQMDNLVDAIVLGSDILSVTRCLADIERQDRELASEVTAINARLGRQQVVWTRDDVRRWLNEVKDLLAVATPEDRRKVVGNVVREVRSVDKGSVQVTYNIIPASAACSGLNQSWLPT